MSNQNTAVEHNERTTPMPRSAFSQNSLTGCGSESANTIRYDTRCYFNVRSKADISQLNLPHGTDN